MKIRTKRRIAEAVAVIAFFAMLGAVGGMEMNWIPVGQGAVEAIGMTVVAAAASWKAGWMRR